MAKLSNTPEMQSITAKKAESQRPFHGEDMLKNAQISQLFQERARQTIADLEELGKAKILSSPFLEIGAGSVQRTIALSNHFALDGVATDISPNSLRDATYTLCLLGYETIPFRICCDAHHLPFLADTFNFLFCYQTLHHFENPIPVVIECYRVLGRGGHFFFNEEPMDSSLRRLLRGERTLSHPPTRLQKIGYRLGVEKLFWDDGLHERSLGMTEARFDIHLWRKALEPFSQVVLEVNRKLKIQPQIQKNDFYSRIAGVVGGNVKGLYKKIQGETATDDFRERIMCLDCRSPMPYVEVDDEQMHCAHCGRSYPVINGISRMLPKQLEELLLGFR